VANRILHVETYPLLDESCWAIVELLPTEGITRLVEVTVTTSPSDWVDGKITGDGVERREDVKLDAVSIDVGGGDEEDSLVNGEEELLDEAGGGSTPEDSEPEFDEDDDEDDEGGESVDEEGEGVAEEAEVSGGGGRLVVSLVVGGILKRRIVSAIGLRQSAGLQSWEHRR
jgi:hypothetical protein